MDVSNFGCDGTLYFVSNYSDELQFELAALVAKDSGFSRSFYSSANDGNLKTLSNKEISFPNDSDISRCEKF